jgi:Ssp1 endopeptidase immunity protein Rap1a
VKTTMIVLLMLAAAVTTSAGTPTQNEMHATLMTPTELYRICSVAQRITSRNPARPDEVLINGTQNEREAANKCWGYLMGVIDSTPIDKSFSPPEERRLSEWVDIVVAYLKANTEKWSQPAFFLVRKASSQKSEK